MSASASSTITNHVVTELKRFLLRQGLPPTPHVPDWTSEQRERHKHIVLAWYTSILYYSRQGSVTSEVLTQEATLQKLVTLAAISNVNPAMLKDLAKRPQRLDSSMRLTLNLTNVLAHAPAGKQNKVLWWCMVNTGTTPFDALIDESNSHWRQQDRNYIPAFQHASDAVMVLRSILFIVKLISIATAQEGMTADTDPDLVIFVLWQMLEKPLTHISYWCETASDAMRLQYGFGTPPADANTGQACQLSAAIVRLILPLIRSSLADYVEDIKEYCAVLKRVLLPQWGQSAETAKSVLLKSGQSRECCPANCLAKCFKFSDTSQA